MSGSRRCTHQGHLKAGQPCGRIRAAHRGCLPAHRTCGRAYPVPRSVQAFRAADCRRIWCSTTGTRHGRHGYSPSEDCDPQPRRMGTPGSAGHRGAFPQTWSSSPSSKSESVRGSTRWPAPVSINTCGAYRSLLYLSTKSSGRSQKLSVSSPQMKKVPRNLTGRRHILRLRRLPHPCRARCDQECRIG